MLVALLAVAGCSARVSRLVESATFYAPSRQAFDTPEGLRDVTIQVGGRSTLHGWWLDRAAGVEHRGTVLFCHGNAGNLPDHLAFVERLPEHGFDVLMFDYRGYGRSGGVRQMHRVTLLRDTRAALRYVRQETEGQDAPLVLLGHSMGGVIGAALIAERPDAFDAAVLVAPFSSFPRVASDFAGPLGWLLIPGGLAAEQTIQRFGRTPVLLVHGGRDRIVRAYHTGRIAASAREAGVEVSVLELPDANHVDVFDEQHGTISAIVAFVTERASDQPARGPTTSGDRARPE